MACYNKWGVRPSASMVWNPRFVNENQVASRVPQGVAPLGSRTFVIEGMGVTASWTRPCLAGFLNRFGA